MEQNHKDLSCGLLKVDKKNTYNFKKVNCFDDVNFKIELSSLPLLSDFIHTDDFIMFDNYKEEENNGKKTQSIQGHIIIGGHQIDFPLKRTISYNSNDKETNTKTQKGEADIKWVSIKKVLNIFSFEKAGFQLTDTGIIFQLNASIQISILRFSIIDFKVQAQFPSGSPVTASISGLEVNMKTQGFKLTGGLIKEEEAMIFDGELVLETPSFTGILASSFGKLNNADYTFFAYVLVQMENLISTPVMIDGVALGLGINRRINIPDYKKLTEFPFIAPLLGSKNNPGELDAGDSPSEALEKIKDYIEPVKGDYFLTIGLGFTICEVIPCFALVSVVFGTDTRISLIGTGSVTLPPDVDKAGITPIASAEIVMSAEFAPVEGYYKIMGGLTDSSYILSKKIKILGGFALCQWFKGKYAGDFIYTIGGCHHPSFQNIHYPEVDKIGINANLGGVGLKGGAYFAITPNCMMAGLDIEISKKVAIFTLWCKAGATFLLNWKPFHYDTTVYLSLGVTLKIDIWFVHITISVSVGAHARFYGPEFGGEAWIKVCKKRVGFSFGAGERAAAAISGTEFCQSFLPKDKNGAAAPIVGSISSGLNGKKNSRNMVSSSNLALQFNSKIPFRGYYLDGNQYHSLYTNDLGVVPMKKNTLDSSIHITFFKEMEDGTLHTMDSSDFIIAPSYENILPALWNSQEPQLNQSLIEDVPTGIDIKSKPPIQTVFLPSANGSYEMKQLTENEPIYKTFSWSSFDEPVNTAGRYENAMNAIRQTFSTNQSRASLLAGFHNRFGTVSDARINDLGIHPQYYYRANPVLKTSGAAEN